MNYHYKIALINEKEHWIYIDHDERRWHEIDAFVNLMKAIQHGCNGKIIDVGDTKYKIAGAELDLIYQWDSCFDIVVIYRKKEQKEEAIKFLQNYFDKINI